MYAVYLVVTNVLCKQSRVFIKLNRYEIPYNRNPQSHDMYGIVSRVHPCLKKCEEYVSYSICINLGKCPLWECESVAEGSQFVGGLQVILPSLANVVPTLRGSLRNPCS
jgi:hypothetical protein